MITTFPVWKINWTVRSIIGVMEKPCAKNLRNKQVRDNSVLELNDGNEEKRMNVKKFREKKY